jgi:cytochrome c-type biogenesis protein CcmH
MIGWLILGAIGTAVFAALWALGLPRSLWSFAGAALMLGAAGYALQARPDLPGAPVQARKQPRADDPTLRELRGALFGRFTADDSFFFASDALMRGGDPDKAAKLMLGGVRASPGDAALWTWLGITLAEADGRVVSPAAGVAFRRAVAIAPKHPGPRFFYGLAHVRAGQFAAARQHWADALKLTPANASYRNDIAMRLMLLDRFLELQAREQRTPPAN